MDLNPGKILACKSGFPLNTIVKNGIGSITWSFVSNSTNQTAKDQLSAFLLANTAENITIPPQYLEQYVSYSFKAEFLRDGIKYEQSRGVGTIQMLRNVDQDNCNCTDKVLI